MSKQKSDKKLNFKQRQSLSFIEQKDPPFLTKIKEKLGYRESTISDKFSQEEEECDEDPSKDRDDIRNMKEDERPQIVVLNPETDVSIEQLDQEIEKVQEEEDRKKILKGKIVFRKPEKRAAEVDKKDDNDQAAEKKSRRNDKGSEESPPVKSKQAMNRLLSFGDDEDSDG